MKKRVVTLFIFVAFFVTFSQAQLAYSYFPFSSDFAISTNPDKGFFGDIRMETNTFFSNIDLELNALFNIKRKERINYYTGAGVNFDFNGQQPLNGIALHLGLRAKPFEKLKNLHLIFEFAPLIDVSSGNFDGFLRTQFGVSYAMSKKK